MKRRTWNSLNRPIVGTVVELNRYIVGKRHKAKKCLQYDYIDDIIKKCAILFQYALRQLNGKDYVRRTLELTEEITTQSYLVAALGGFVPKEVAHIERLCDQITDMVVRISKSPMSESSHEA